MDLRYQDGEIDLAVENIGGIEQTTVTLTRGTTVLAGRNATNRTSLLQAIMAALGSDDVTIKGDADHGAVELKLDDTTYHRTLHRTDDTVHGEGDTFCEDPDAAELYAFLLRSNEVRRRVTSGGDLRELIMAPIDTEEIQAEINCRTEQRRAVSEEIESIQELKPQLPELERQRQDLRAEIDQKRQQLQEVEAEIEEHNATVDETKAEQDELESTLAELRQRRAALEDVRYDIETITETIEELRAERADIEQELDALSVPDEDERTHLDEQISRYRRRKQQLESDLNEIQTVIEFNEDMLESPESGPVEALEADNTPVTDALTPDQTVTCWTCGSEVAVDRIESTITTLQEVARDRIGEINDLEAEIEALVEQRQTIEQRQHRHETLTDRRAQIDAQLDDRQAALTTKQDRRRTLIESIEQLETEVEELEASANEHLLELHRQANNLEHEIGRLEAELEGVTEEIADIESELDRLEELTAEREQLADEIADLRTRIETIEAEAIEQFNDHMDEVLDALEYDNLERIWIERRQQETREGRQTVTETVFELHIVRRTDSGRAYEDTIDHLSESEREVTGLIFALAGYLAHDVHDTCPVMLLDSLEAIDAQRIADLVAYIESYTEILVVALLPEDAAALDDSYPRVTNI